MIESVLRDVQRLVDNGLVEKAVAIIDVSQVQLSLQPRALLPILEDLDRKRNDRTLRIVIDKVQELNLLPLESSVFDLRMKFRAADHAGALGAVERVLSISPSHIEALRTGGRIANLSKDVDIGVGYWERLAHSVHDDREAALQAARGRFRLGHYPKALEWAGKAASGQQRSTEALRIAIDAGIHAGWPPVCDQLLVRLLDIDEPSALAALSRLSRTHDCETVGRVLQAMRPRLADDAVYQDIVSDTYSWWLKIGLEHELAIRESAAAAHYRAARAVRPDITDAQVLLDRLKQPSLIAMRDAFDSRDFSDTVEHGTEVVRIDPDCLEAWQVMGRAHFALGNLEPACDAFRQCTVLNGADARAWLTLGLTLNQLGTLLAALAAFRTAHRLGNTEVRAEADPLLNTLYPLLVGDARRAIEAGKFNWAWEALDAVLAARPIDRDALAVAQLALRALRERIRQAWASGLDSAVDLCRLYLVRAPGDAYVSTVLGRTLMRMRAYAEALPIWEKTSMLDPGDSHIHLQVARCCRSLKLRERGMIAAETALRLDPSLQEAAEVADLLRLLPPELARRDSAD